MDSGIIICLSTQLGEEVQCMSVRRGFVASASEWCEVVRNVVRWGIGAWCMVAETSSIGVAGEAASKAIIWEQGNVVGHHWMEMDLNQSTKSN